MAMRYTMEEISGYSYMEQGKYRNEIKYICSQAQLGLIENRIRPLCRPDPHGGEDGTYLITSLYFDDYDNSCYYENENGVDPREKFRIRIYNRQLSYIALECKRKQSGKIFKETCRLTDRQFKSLLNQEWSGLVGTDPLINKFYIACQTKCLRPKVIVEYERTTFIYPQGNVRIAFDRNITTSSRVQQFGQINRGRPVMSTGQHILEVKYDELLPDYLYNALQIEHLRQVAFSKYYICRKFINQG